MTWWRSALRKLRRRWVVGVPLRYSLVVLVAVAVTVPGVILLMIEQQLSARAQDEMLLRSEQALMSVGRFSVVEPMWVVDRDALGAAVQRLLDSPQVAAVRVTETGGSVALVQRVRPGVELDAQGTMRTPALRRYVESVERGGETIGTLTMWFDSTYGQTLRAQRRTEMLVLVAVQVLLSMLALAAALVLRVFRPLENLKLQASALVRASPDATTVPFIWRRNDELSVLGRHMGQVQEQLHTLFTQLEAKNAELQRLAMYDHLTGLPNRALFVDLVGREILQARRAQQRFAIFFIDLDRFKLVNDRLGHEAGDTLLVEVSRRLKESVREVDLVCRQSGDEFLVMVRDVGRAELLGEVADRILLAMEAPVPVHTGTAQVSASIGIALFPDDADEFELLLRHADAAMYQAKSLGRARYSFFHQALNERVESQHALAHQIEQAIAQDELLMHYQPKVDAASGAIVGVEALVRWQHPQRGLLYPGQFITVAEEFGLIADLGAWTLRASCRQWDAWRRAGIDVGTMAFNVSAMEFRDHRLLDALQRTMREFDIPAGALEVEITESVLMEETGSSERIMAGLRGMGVGIAIDDFGTGYSSLSYLKHLHPTLLKMDRSFVRDADSDDDSRAIVRGIVGLAQALNLRMVAEGVETVAQLNFLRGSGCQIVQGYLVARPMPAEQLQAWLAAPPHLASGLFTAAL